MIETMSSLAFGSSFWHGSHTRTGNIADNQIIQVLAYIIHQTMVAPLNSDDPVVNDLSQNGTRPFSGVELNEQMTNMFLNTSSKNWGSTILDMDKPNYWRTFAGIITTFLSLTVEDEKADQIILALAELFSFPEEEFDFITEEFLPKVTQD